MLIDLGKDPNAIKALEAIGPEVMTKAQGGDFIGEAITSNPVVGMISDKLTANTSDSDTTLIDPIAKFQHFRFYPAGTSYQSINHFRQMLLSGKFQKYDYGSKE